MGDQVQSILMRLESPNPTVFVHAFLFLHETLTKHSHPKRLTVSRSCTVPISPIENAESPEVHHTLSLAFCFLFHTVRCQRNLRVGKQVLFPFVPSIRTRTDRS